MASILARSGDHPSFKEIFDQSMRGLWIITKILLVWGGIVGCIILVLMLCVMAVVIPLEAYRERKNFKAEGGDEEASHELVGRTG
jgi:type II secretory pathway component PulF